jgi:hypothetical protein
MDKKYVAYKTGEHLIWNMLDIYFKLGEYIPKANDVINVIIHSQDDEIIGEEKIIIKHITDISPEISDNAEYDKELGLTIDEIIITVVYEIRRG